MGHSQSVEASSEAQLKLLVLKRISTNMRATILCVLVFMLAYSEGRPHKTIKSENKGGRHIRSTSFFGEAPKNHNNALAGTADFLKWQLNKAKPVSFGKTKDNTASFFGGAANNNGFLGGAAGLLGGAAENNDASHFKWN